MRGKVARSIREKLGVRITPAHAGKSWLLPLRPESVQDHPRACGEKERRQFVNPAQQESPPRMRGKGIALLKAVDHVGITPAHAGKSPRCNTFQGFPRGHPRACGEKRYAHVTTFCNPGSPPRMRGKELLLVFRHGVGGITPAHAGKSGICTGCLHAAPDHPRACGEKPGRKGVIRPVQGSPPRMRGKDQESPCKQPTFNWLQQLFHSV